MTVVVAGYYGFGNLGDELILESLIRQIRLKHPASSIVVLSQNPTETASRFCVNAISRWNVVSVMKSFWKAPLFILGGGGLLQDQTSRWSPIYYLGLVVLARLFGVRVISGALAIESLHRWLNVQLASWICRHCFSFLSVRDVESELILLSWGVPPSKIKVVPDPVFQLPGFASPWNVESPVLLIPRVPCPSRGSNFLSFLSRNFNIGLLYPSLEKKWIHDHSLALSGPLLCLSTFEEARAVFSKASVVVSARFHGLVLAILAGRPFVGIGDPHKVARLCAQWGQPYVSWNVSSDELQAAIQQARENGCNPRHRSVSTETGLSDLL